MTEQSKQGAGDEPTTGADPTASFAGPAPRGDDPASRRARKLHKLIHEVMRLRSDGKHISDQQVIDKYSELMPELSDALQWLAKVEATPLAEDSDAFPGRPLRPQPPDSVADDDPPTDDAADEGEDHQAIDNLTIAETIVDDSDADTTSYPPAAEPEEDTGPVIEAPGYTIIRKLSHGGQAVVYLAQQISTGKRVAIKVMWEGPFAHARERARFEREVQILAALEHPNIVGVMDKGVTSHGAMYFVMNYIEGRPLDDWISDHNAPGRADSADQLPVSHDPAELLKLFMRICDAVNAAHLRGVIHRDLKPSNIIIDRYGEPHILDFGLARTALNAMTDEVNPQPVTVTGKFIGSLPWASPEQAEGVASKIDVRTDVYSLGVILYQMLTGQFPYEVVGNMRDVLDNIMRADPTPPSKVIEARIASEAARNRRMRKHHKNPVNSELEAIVLHALEKQAEHRYQSAGELSRDIANYLSGKPTLAAGAPRSGARWRRLRMNLQKIGGPKVAAACVAGVAVAVVGGLFAAGVFNSPASSSPAPATLAAAQGATSEDTTSAEALTEPPASTPAAPSSAQAATPEPAVVQTPVESASASASESPTASEPKVTPVGPAPVAVASAAPSAPLEVDEPPASQASDAQQPQQPQEPQQSWSNPQQPPRDPQQFQPRPFPPRRRNDQNVLVTREMIEQANRGEWTSLAQNISLDDANSSQAVMHVQIEGGYELKIDFRLERDDTGFSVTAPSIYRHDIQVGVNINGQTGLFDIRTQQALAETPATAAKVDADKKIELKLFINEGEQQTTIRASVDGREVLTYHGSSDIFPQPPRMPGAMPLPMRLRAHGSAVVLIEDVSIRLRDGARMEAEDPGGQPRRPGAPRRPGRPAGRNDSRNPPDGGDRYGSDDNY